MLFGKPRPTVTQEDKSKRSDNVIFFFGGRRLSSIFVVKINYNE